jgi:hypothetical protein
MSEATPEEIIKIVDTDRGDLRLCFTCLRAIMTTETLSSPAGLPACETPPPEGSYRKGTADTRYSKTRRGETCGNRASFACRRSIR